MGALLGVISDIHRVRTNSEDPVDIINDPKQVPHPQATLTKKWAMNFKISFLKLICLYFANLLCFIRLAAQNSQDYSTDLLLIDAYVAELKWNDIINRAVI